MYLSIGVDQLPVWKPPYSFYWQGRSRFATPEFATGEVLLHFAAGKAHAKQLSYTRVTDMDYTGSVGGWQVAWLVSQQSQ